MYIIPFGFEELYNNIGIRERAESFHSNEQNDDLFAGR